jgi:hypothetical protein
MDESAFEALLQTLRDSMAASVTIAVAAFLLMFVLLLWMWRNTALEDDGR